MKLTCLGIFSLFFLFCLSSCERQKSVPQRAMVIATKILRDKFISGNVKASLNGVNRLLQHAFNTLLNQMSGVRATCVATKLRDKYKLPA